jgi:hypothetical protein
MQRFELQDHGEPGRLAQFVLDDVSGDFRREREWESHKFYRVEATSLEVSGNATGALVEGGPAFISPGRKNEAGETLWLALMPPQPALPIASTTSMVSASKFLFILTCLV